MKKFLMVFLCLLVMLALPAREDPASSADQLCGIFGWGTFL